MKRFAAALAAVLMLTACTQVEENIPVMAETSAVTEDTDASVDVTTAVSSEIVSEEITSETEPETSEAVSESETTAAEEVQTEAPAAAENSAEETSAAETTTTEAVYEDAQAESTGTVTGIELTFYDVTLSQGEHKMPIVTMSPESAPDKSEMVLLSRRYFGHKGRQLGDKPRLCSRSYSPRPSLRRHRKDIRRKNEPCKDRRCFPRAPRQIRRGRNHTGSA